ncbi:Na+-dependent transporter [Sphingobium sp. AP49]|uniref:hypothetical protein n=1 Tax=Sphingobium sp. AP49 TaxID=1144307 RepID=UPI00026EE394|nr:hypothetical protein [Sphingobium sp. AP49]WHO41038.1 Na+-dependent transporter [Sphingobium sp. AP49]
MEVIKQLIPLLVTLSLALLIISAAMASSRGQFAYVLCRPLLLLKAIVAVNIIPLVAALIVVSIAPGLSLPSKTGILLMAISPVPPLVPGKALKSGARPEYVYGLQLAMGVVSLIAVPALGTLVAHHYDAQAVFPLSVIGRNLVIGLIIPMIIGIALGRWIAPDFSRRIAPMVGTIGMLLVVIAFLPILVQAWPQLMALVGDGTVIAMAVVAIVAMLGGHLLGGEMKSDSYALAFASATRHPGIAMALIGANHANAALLAAVLLFLLIALIVTIPYQILIKRGSRAGSTDIP